jgi:PAS domain S-box-containing protein
MIGFATTKVLIKIRTKPVELSIIQDMPKALPKLEPANSFFAESLFDALPDVNFFVKDLQGRYRVVNQNLVRACGLKRKDQLIGRTALEVFPEILARGYAEQDRQVLEKGVTIHGKLELNVYANGDHGWALSYKTPLLDKHGKIIGLTGMIRDLLLPDHNNPTLRQVAKSVLEIDTHFAQALQVSKLARLSGVSVMQLERHFKKLFQITPQQYIAKVRLETALRLLRTKRTIGEIALECGFTDHSAFTRHFKKVVGLTPRQYGELKHVSK